MDVLYHEATYDSSLEEKAVQRGHSTARQAGKIATLANAKALIIGHYSKRYDEVDILVDEAREEFHTVVPAADRLQIDLDKLACSH